tara:strand:+ start:17 stop:388 length:372 start_codon:yes stop_codon:yes gene_type:complete
MEWISINEVCNLTKKSNTTIRNLARKLKAEKSKHIKLERLPSGHDKMLFSLSYVNSKLIIGKPIKNSNTTIDSNSNKIIEILERQIITKDEQINNLQQLLAMEKQQVQMLLDAPKKKKRWLWF